MLSTAAAFASCQDTKPLASSNNIHSYALTNRGLSIKLRGTKLSEHIFLVYLNCTTHLHSNEPSRVGILLQELEEPGQFARIQNAGCSLVPIPIKTSHQDHKFQNKYVDYNIQQTTTRTEYFKFVSGARISLPALSSNEASKFFYFPSAPPDWVTRFVEGSYISLQLIPPHVDKNNPFLRSIKVPKQACAVRLKGSQSLESLDIAFDQLSDFHMQLTSKRIEKSVDIITDVLPDGDLKSLQRLDSSHKVGERWVLKFQRDRIRDDRTFTFNLVVELENGFAIVGFVKIGVVGFAQNVMWDVEIGGPVTESSGTGLKKDGKEKSEKSGRQFWKFLKGG